MMRDINVAKDTLLDDVKRADYDRQLLKGTSDDDKSRESSHETNTQSSGYSSLNINPDYRKSTASQPAYQPSAVNRFIGSNLGCATLFIVACLIFIGIVSLSENGNTKTTTETSSQLKQVAFLPN